MTLTTMSTQHKVQSLETNSAVNLIVDKSESLQRAYAEGLWLARDSFKSFAFIFSAVFTIVLRSRHCY